MYIKSKLYSRPTLQLCLMGAIGLLTACTGTPVPEASSSSSAFSEPTAQVSSSVVASSSSLTVSSSSLPAEPVISSSQPSSMAASSIPPASSSSKSSSSVASSSSKAIVVFDVPSRIQAQDYAAAKDDQTREGDTTGPCAGGKVDMKTTDDRQGVCKIGWTAAGEWVEYSLASNSIGQYDLILRLASNDNNKKVSVTIDGVEVGSVTAPNKGFTTFENRKISNVSIGVGEHTLRVTFENDGIDFNYLDIIDYVEPVTPPVVTPPPKPPVVTTPPKPPVTTPTERCNKNDTNNDIRNPSNHGELDDRTCKHRYSERTFGNSPVKWGKYEISADSSTDADLSARMERKFAPRAKPGNNSYQRFKGTFRIDSTSGPGKVSPGFSTAFLQFKGKHQGSTGDPAIALFVLEEVQEGNQIYFNIYREQITKRNGRFSNNGRKYVFLTRVKRNESFRIEAETGFRGNPVKEHYANVKINNKWYYFNVPEPKKGTETGIRYGAYVIKKGTARVFVSQTEFSSN